MCMFVCTEHIECSWQPAHTLMCACAAHVPLTAFIQRQDCILSFTDMVLAMTGALVY